MSARPRSRHLVTLGLAVVVFCRPTTAAGQDADPAGVRRAIERGIAALLGRVTPQDTLRYRTKKKGGRIVTVRGRVTRDRGGILRVKTADGKTVSVRKGLIVDWDRAGFVRPEMEGLTHGGPSALAAFALISAGVETTRPRMRLLLEALADHEAKESGTYVHSLRASVWSLLLDRRISQSHKKRYRRLLRKDMNWLARGMGGDGTYSYDRSGGNGDNSNTQFANLGLWSGSVAGIEVADRLWLNIANYWLKTQHPGGGWSYTSGSRRPRSSMTIAGCNSLYIVLDRFYARSDRPYRLFEGARPNKKARLRMEEIYRAIADGDKYLELNPPDIVQSRGYELFGLERLGLAGGLARIGGVDWFRHYAPRVARRGWGSGPVADSFALIFLVHGQAPILMQKLEHGDDIHDWNYYHRDLPGLMRYLSRTFERLYRWQRLPVDASLHSLEDAPILYISGRQELRLPNESLRRIRRYVDRGGMVFLHANRAGQRFVQSATSVFESLFADRGLRFETLDPAHPIYHCHFGTEEKAWKHPVPFRALADGPRILVLLCPVDIAGAWHQDLSRFEDLFRIMANVRVYCAPPYGRLPSVLREEAPPCPPARARGTLALARLRHAGAWDAHLGVWQRQHASLLRRTGIDLRADKTGDAVNGESLRSFDVVHLTTRGRSSLSPDLRAELTDYLRGGGFLLIDAADGQPAGTRAVRRLVETLDIGGRDVLAADHPIASGAIPGGRALEDLETTRAGASLHRENAPPPILTRSIAGRLAVVACPFDLVAGLDSHFVWNRIGYRPESTARIVDNILLWRLHDLGRTGSRRARGASP